MASYDYPTGLFSSHTTAYSLKHWNSRARKSNLLLWGIWLIIVFIVDQFHVDLILSLLPLARYSVTLQSAYEILYSIVLFVAVLPPLILFGRLLSPKMLRWFHWFIGAVFLAKLLSVLAWLWPQISPFHIIIATLLILPPTALWLEYLQEKISHAGKISYLPKVLRHTFLIFSLSLMGVFFTLLYAAEAISRHNNFLTSFDLAIFDQTVWHLSNFQIPISSIRGIPNIFGDHFHPIIVFLSPFYWLWSDPRMLLILQSVILALGLIPLYFLCRFFNISRLHTFLLSFLYITYPSFQTHTFTDFHEMAFVPLFILSAFYFLMKRNWLWYFFFVFLLLMTKENISIYLGFFGLFIFFYGKNRLIGFLTSLSSLAAFLLLFLFLIPTLSGQTSFSYFELYADETSSSQSELAQSPISQMMAPLKNIQENITLNSLKHERWEGTLTLMSPFLISIIYTPTSLILFLPAIIEKVLTDYPPLWSPRIFHYNVFFLPFGLITLMALLRKKKEIQNSHIRRIFKQVFKARPPSFNAYIISFALIASIFVSFSMMLPFPHPLKVPGRTPEEPILLRSLIQDIPVHASISASQNVIPHLSQRESAYTIPKISDAEYVILHYPAYSTSAISQYTIKQKIVFEYLESHPAYRIKKQNDAGFVFQRVNPYTQDVKDANQAVCFKAIDTLAKIKQIALIHQKIWEKQICPEK